MILVLILVVVVVAMVVVFVGIAGSVGCDRYAVDAGRRDAGWPSRWACKGAGD